MSTGTRRRQAIGDRPTEIRELVPDLFMIRTGLPQVYLWRDGSEGTMIDAGFPGDEPALAAAFAELGLTTAALRRLVLTHHHEDHTGAAVASWGNVEVVAHRADAPIIRGDRPPPTRTLTEEERAERTPDRSDASTGAHSESWAGT